MRQKGLLYGVAAYGLWGIMPLYFEQVRDVPPVELLAHRIVWSFVLMAAIVTWLRRWPEVRRGLAERRERTILVATTVLVAVNWLVYIYSVYTRQVVLASVGYFLLPLVNVLLGTLLLRERLGRLQWMAVALASMGVSCFVVEAGQLPWIAVVIAFSFGVYGLLRKHAGVDGLVGLTVETLLLAPLSAGALLYLAASGEGRMGTSGLRLDLVLLLSGIVTAAPLFCFGEAARRLPLTTLGFLQYLAPTLQLILAVTLLREEFGPLRQIGFGFIWAGLAVFTIASLQRMSRTPVAESVPLD